MFNQMCRVTASNDRHDFCLSFWKLNHRLFSITFFNQKISQCCVIKIKQVCHKAKKRLPDCGIIYSIAGSCSDVFRCYHVPEKILHLRQNVYRERRFSIKVPPCLPSVATVSVFRRPVFKAASVGVNHCCSQCSIMVL